MSFAIKKIKEFSNPLLRRKEYLFAIIHDGEPTPSRVRIREELSKLLGISRDLIVVRKLKTEFGTNTSYATVHIYESKDDLLSIEPKHILKRDEIISE
ncbi:MAG: 30S ribosomal protein S24e [Crenarchaeota archaeon]|nr:30S ribosomal protein S24e [Thermoproteota archaeon]MCR8454280.1 30S ribosomal protein S24e [Thermoproteota archaeon]MCR8455048.1 30S ribosomal protein S24e [Thermoproteota archaeon]MCR8463547.1 30S ribosomal protein S24e [Thermoproteota archaeon]MCR8470788.1 30S ribosomal protein S24e [Thermoproteota archaeon]